jgi:hypothetical protein
MQLFTHGVFSETIKAHVRLVYISKQDMFSTYVVYVLWYIFKAWRKQKLQCLHMVTSRQGIISRRTLKL